MGAHETPVWSVREADDEAVRLLAVSCGVSDVTARVLAGRGYEASEAVARFLAPSFARDWLDPLEIPGMAAAAERVARAVSGGERVVVFGDFDLDGISAAAVATRGLRALGGVVSAVVPHRFREGYGLTNASAERVRAQRPDLIITVDTGISSRDEVASLLAAGIDVVVTDHHEPSGLVPEGIPVANPKLSDQCLSRALSGAGVALKLVEAVGHILGTPAAHIDLLDLATLGTVADIVPLVGENRALVAAGVRALREHPRAGLAALATVAGVAPESINSETIAFALAPRLNAAGRMDDPVLALDLLLTDDAFEAEHLAAELDRLNRQRQDTEADLSRAAFALADRVWHGERVVVLAGEGWHEGVRGVVASKVALALGRPTILFSIEDGVARGSGRSAGRVNLFGAIDACSHLLTRYGGHEAAVGLTLDAGALEQFARELNDYLDTLDQDVFVVERVADAEIALSDLSVELGAEIEALEPFGQSNPRPTFIARRVFMNGQSKVGKTGEHLRFTAFDGAHSVPAIAFRLRDLDSFCGIEHPVDIAFNLSVDAWRGRTRVQMMVRDILGRTAEVVDSAPAEFIDDLFANADAVLAREEYAGIDDAPSFHTKLAGVTFEGRQDLVAQLVPGLPLRLERQPDNPHDTNACALVDPTGSQVGFLNRRLAAVLAPAVDAGVEYDVEVTDVTGGDDRAFGVNILVSRRDAAEAEADATEALREARARLSNLTADELDGELVRAFIGGGRLHDAQARSLASLREGRRTLTVMATGRGKSLIFHLHAARIALAQGRVSVFVYPLRALVADQMFHLQESLSDLGLKVTTLTGETAGGERDTIFAAIGAGEVDAVLTTPEFLVFHAARFAQSGRVGFIVVDEAHHVGLARSGHRPAYIRLGEAVETLGSPTVLAVTATAGDDVAALIRSSLKIETVILDPTVRENLLVVDERERRDKDEYLVALARSGGKLVVYVNSREKSVQVARMLRKRVPGLGHRVAFYNGGLSRSVRHAVERAFRDGDIDVVVATSAFGEGVNIPDIRGVVLYHLPFNEVEFNQMSGRAGRDGAAARIHLLYGERDARINEMILTSAAPSRDDLAAVYRVLRDVGAAQGDRFEITNTEIAERASRLRKQFALDERGVSTAVGIFRELGLVEGEGHGGYRRLSVVAGAARVELSESVRYAEGLDEQAQFGEFRTWALTAEPARLLERFNRPILPTHD